MSRLKPSNEKEYSMLDFICIFKGHFRTFEKTCKIWEKSLEECDHKYIMHTWEKQDAETTNWHSNGLQSNKLSNEQIELLHTYDKDCVIESQSFTDEEKAFTRYKAPFKCYLYYWQGIHSCLRRINEESKYILISRYDATITDNFKTITCEEDEIVIAYAYSVGSKFPFTMTDLVYVINYKDKHKLENIPQTLLDWKNDETIYKWPEDHITDFFYKNWKKVTAKWLIGKHFSLVR